MPKVQAWQHAPTGTLFGTKVDYLRFRCEQEHDRRVEARARARRSAYTRFVNTPKGFGTLREVEDWFAASKTLDWFARYLIPSEVFGSHACRFLTKKRKIKHSRVLMASSTMKIESCQYGNVWHRLGNLVHDHGRGRDAMGWECRVKLYTRLDAQATKRVLGKFGICVIGYQHNPIKKESNGLYCHKTNMIFYADDFPRMAAYHAIGVDILS